MTEISYFHVKMKMKITFKSSVLFNVKKRGVDISFTGKINILVRVESFYR